MNDGSIGDNVISSISNDILPNLQKYLPEPASTGVGLFSSIMQTVGGTTKSSSGEIPITVSSEFQNLIEMQMEFQTDMQEVSMYSNIERSKHETAMAPIRNMRLG